MKEVKNGKHEEIDRVEWYRNGLLHREDGPAIDFRNNRQDWYLNGLRHRTDGPAITHADGTEVWYFHGIKHRENGPTVQLHTGENIWYLNGKKHREDGPAVETILNGAPHQEWWMNDQELTKEEFNHWLEKKKLNEKLHATFLPKHKSKRGKI